MSDTTPAPEATGGEAQEAPATDKPMEHSGKVYDEAYVKQLRDEAASHRVAKKEAVEQAEATLRTEYEAKLAEKDVAYVELQNQLGQAWIELEKVYTSIEAKVPSDKVRAFTEILSGEDKESIQESVKSRLDLVGGFDSKSPAFDPTQGTGGRDPLPLNGDPIMAALKSAVGIK